MKLKNYFTQTLIIIVITTLTFQFQSCEPEDDCNEKEQPCDSCSMVYKPNIYIYPESSMFLNISLRFPLGGNVVTSIPEYGNGWEVSVEPSGLIDGTYSYLFYESMQPDIWQISKGWNIARDSLDSFFRKNMHAYGFENEEIVDFIEYWIPKLNQSEYYSIFPQSKETIRKAIELELSVKPDRVLRLFYVIKEQNEKIKLTEPNIESFNREGFFITEWGVIL